MNTAQIWPLTLVLLIVPAHAQAQDEAAPWQIGLASTRITPDTPVRMAGYGSRERKQLSEGIAADLHAKAIALQDAEGNRALLVTTDIIGLTRSVSEPLYQRIGKATGLARNAMLINSSHTHTGPAIGFKANIAHLSDAAHIEGTDRYTRWLSDRLVELAAEAIDSLQPARLSWNVGVATFVMNRREFTERGVRLGFNPRGHCDRSVPVLKVQSTDGDTRCLLFGAACHNTTLTGQHMQISGDFAGYAQQFIERELKGDVQAMFMQGCAGDANPFPRGSEEIARIHGMTLGKEVLRLLESEFTPITGTLTTLLRSVELPLQESFAPDDFDKLDRASGSTREVARQIREKLAAGEELPNSYQAPIAVWQFGEDLTLVGLPGEVVVDFVRMIEDSIGPRKLWVSAYNSDVFGYLPSARVLSEGGYEMRGIYSGGFGIFSPRAEQVVVENVTSLAREAGRPASLVGQP